MNIGKLFAGTFLVVVVGAVFVGFASIQFGNALLPQASEPGGSIVFLIAYAFIGIGHLIIGGSVLWTFIILFIAAFAVLVDWVVIKYKRRNGADAVASQLIGSPNPENDSEELRVLDEDSPK